jgi:hypothetical protein
LASGLVAGPRASGPGEAVIVERGLAQAASLPSSAHRPPPPRAFCRHESRGAAACKAGARGRSRAHDQPLRSAPRRCSPPRPRADLPFLPERWDAARLDLSRRRTGGGRCSRATGSGAAAAGGGRRGPALLTDDAASREGPLCRPGARGSRWTPSTRPWCCPATEHAFVVRDEGPGAVGDRGAGMHYADLVRAGWAAR